jgi:hypothetical protein
MKKIILPVLLLICFVSGICAGCSRSKDGDEEKGSIEKFTEQTGKKAADAIKQPINKAKDIDKMSQEHMKDLEKQDTEKGE